jgi:hypothetical protein
MSPTVLESKRLHHGHSVAEDGWRNGGTRHRATAVRAPGLIQIILGAALASALLPADASAHVKWFMPYDVTQAPTSVAHVLTPHSVILFVGFALLVFGGFMSDRYIARKWQFIATESRREDIEERLLRAGMGGFFMALFATGGLILTPELRTAADWPCWLQLGIAISLLSARTCIAGGIGIVVLYAYGVSLYGVFHLADYPMFPGIAAYFALTSFASERLRSLRMPILYVTLCTSLMWGVIEKWAYPQWTLSLLELRPYLTAGFSPGDFLVFAGFVEFALAFYILAGFGLIRLASLALLGIFAAAVLDFGKIDTIGHLPIMVPLLMMFIHGPCRLHGWLHKAGNSAIGGGHKISLVFAASICLFFTVYYGLQYGEYGRRTHQNTFASLPVSHLR